MWHLIADAREARKTQAPIPGGLSITVPAPFPAPVGDEVRALFRIGAEASQEANGHILATGESWTVAFTGHEALVVKDVLERAGHAHPRRFARYKCWIAVQARLEDGKTLKATATIVGLGGCQLTAASGRLRKGDQVRLRFADHEPTVPAQVMWTLARGVVGFKFLEDPASELLVRRIVSEAAQRELQGQGRWTG